MKLFQKAHDWWSRTIRNQPSEVKTVKIIDFITTFWGHSCIIEPKSEADRYKNIWTCHGWCHGIDVGNILVTSGTAKVSIFYWLVKDISYCRDPSDMFFATLEMIKEEPHPSRRQNNGTSQNSKNQIGSKIEIKTREEWEAELNQKEKETH